MIPVAELRPKFLARARREKILAVVFVVALAVVWAGSWWGRTKRFSTAFSLQRVDAKEQRAYLDQQREIEARFDAIVTSFSSSSLPTVNEVIAKVQEVQNRHGIAAQIRATAPRSQDRLTLNTINVNINGASYETLVAFQRDVAVELPTVNLDRISLTPVRQNPVVNARITLNAVEINR